MIDLNRSWMPRALCRGLDLPSVDNTFHAFTKGKRDRWEEAKEICRQCPVLAQCRRDTLGEPEGVWGGLDEHEREAIREAIKTRYKAWPKDRRLTYGRLVRSLRQPFPGRKTPRNNYDRIEQMTGLPERVASRLEKEYEGHLEELRRKRAARAVSAIAPRRELPFPEANGEKDCWVRSAGYMKDGFYKGETADGVFILVQVNVDRHSASQKWVPAEDVRFHREVARYTVRKQHHDDQDLAA